MRPHMPEKRRFDDAQLPVYEQGYYMALAMALRVMRLAEKSWEHVMEEMHSPRVVKINGTRNQVEAAQLARDHRVWKIIVVAVVGVLAVVVVECVVLLAMLIMRAAR